MLPELVYVACPCGNTLKAEHNWPRHLKLKTGEAVFETRSEAHRAATNAGWYMVSESLGGDLCPECRAQTQAPTPTPTKADDTEDTTEEAP